MTQCGMTGLTLSRFTTGIIWNFTHFPLALHFPPIMLIGLGLGCLVLWLRRWLCQRS